MVRKIENLRSTPDEVLIAEHDAVAENTVVGTAYYLNELERRSRERATEAAQALSVRSHKLTIANMALSAVAVIVAILALFLG
jgi:hypothetical protein